MAIKTFTTGEVLTASDTNTYLANSGLVYVDGGSFTAAASFDVTGLSTTYVYYKLVFSATAGAAVNVNAVLYDGATARNSLYYAGNGYAGYDSATGSQNPSNNSASFYLGTATSAYRMQCSMEFRRKASQMFTYTASYTDAITFRALFGGGFRNATDSFDRIRIASSSSTLTGEWRLYGYREP